MDTADGDARSLLNALELAVETSVESWPPPDGSEILREPAMPPRRAYRNGPSSTTGTATTTTTPSRAFIKSLRGSDPDAALYWLARMVYAGEDPAFLFRRMLISASEDVGLADPAALGVVESCARAFERIGLPEGQFHLAQAALYLATAPKSNSALGYFDARAEIEKERAEVPYHLKDASRDGPGFGHGEGYLYPHAYRDHWVAQAYLPEALSGRVFYKPAGTGYEGRIRDEVLRRGKPRSRPSWTPRPPRKTSPTPRPRIAGPSGCPARRLGRRSAFRRYGRASSCAPAFGATSGSWFTAHGRASWSGKPCGTFPRAVWRPWSARSASAT